jgi:H+/Cl- antiporter ClcA
MLHEAMPYDEVYTKVWAERPRNVACEDFKYWCAFAVMGFLIGFCGFLCTLWVQCLCDWVLAVMHDLIYSGAEMGDVKTYNYWVPWLWFTGMSSIFGLIASSMTTYWAQGAAMSGLPEMIGWVNGVNYHDYIGLNILFTKMVGNCLAMGAKLCVGKEGPLAHVGSNCGILTLYLPGFPF